MMIMVIVIKLLYNVVYMAANATQLADCTKT